MRRLIRRISGNQKNLSFDRRTGFFVFLIVPPLYANSWRRSGGRRLGIDSSMGYNSLQAAQCKLPIITSSPSSDSARNSNSPLHTGQASICIRSFFINIPIQSPPGQPLGCYAKAFSSNPSNTSDNPITNTPMTKSAVVPVIRLVSRCHRESGNSGSSG